MENDQLEYGNYFTNKLYISETDEEREKLCREFEQSPEKKKENAVEPLIRFLKDDRDTREHNALRSWIPILLGYTKSEEAYRILIEQLHEEENDVVLKWIVITLVREFDNESRFEHIYRKYQDEKERIMFARQIIVEAIADYVMDDQHVGPYGIQILKDAIDDRYSDARFPAIRAIGKVRERSAVPKLKKLLSGKKRSEYEVEGMELKLSIPERRAIVEALSEIGDTSAIETFIRIAKNEEEEIKVRLISINALGEIAKTLTSEQLEPINDTLDVLTCHPEYLIAHNATAAIRCFQSDEKAAEELAEYGLKAREADLERLADAIRMVHTETAIEYLDGVTGENEDRAKSLIAKIGGGVCCRNIK